MLRHHQIQRNRLAVIRDVQWCWSAPYRQTSPVNIGGVHGDLVADHSHDHINSRVLVTLIVSLDFVADIPVGVLSGAEIVKPSGVLVRIRVLLTETDVVHIDDQLNDFVIVVVSCPSSPVLPASV